MKSDELICASLIAALSCTGQTPLADEQLMLVGRCSSATEGAQASALSGAGSAGGRKRRHQARF